MLTPRATPRLWLKTSEWSPEDQPGPCLWRREQTTQASPVSWWVSRLAYIVHGYECFPFSWWMSESTSCVMAGPLLSSPRSNRSMVFRGWPGGSPWRMRVVTGSPVALAAAAAVVRPPNKPAMREKSPVRRNWRRPRTTGVRPSPGAAGSDPPATLEHCETLLSADVAAPGDGRTPAQSPLVGHAGCARLSSGPEVAVVFMNRHDYPLVLPLCNIHRRAQ